MAMAHDVFVSYSSKDKPTADARWKGSVTTPVYERDLLCPNPLH
jgi:hypothetical protein